MSCLSSLQNTSGMSPLPPYIRVSGLLSSPTCVSDPLSCSISALFQRRILSLPTQVTSSLVTASSSEALHLCSRLRPGRAVLEAVRGPASLGGYPLAGTKESAMGLGAQYAKPGTDYAIGVVRRHVAGTDAGHVGTSDALEQQEEEAARKSQGAWQTQTRVCLRARALL
eukprot:2551955-Rhodomonas_salina.1